MAHTRGLKPLRLACLPIISATWYNVIRCAVTGVDNHLGRSSGLRAKQYKERRIFTVDHLVSHDWLLGECSTLDVRAGQ